jgi:prepilin-type N-terminal cleavage/methylation domain-containing protein
LDFILRIEQFACGKKLLVSLLERRKRMRIRGFTLIELMIVVAIIAIIAAIAIPSLLRSRMAANETAAAASCKAFAEAEEIFHRTDYSGNGCLKYATALSGAQSLLDGSTGGSNALGLIDKTFGGAEGQPATGTPKAGYVFTVLTEQGSSATGGTRIYVVGTNMTLGYAMNALPGAYDSTGRDSFGINGNGTIFQLDQGPGITTHTTFFNPTTSWVPTQ